MGLHEFSDYGSGCSTNSSGSWPSQDKLSSYQPHHKDTLDSKPSSYLDLVMGRCTLDDVMREFKMNGSDSPYNPDEDNIWGCQTGELPLSGLGPAGAYLRQQSCPAERSLAPAPASAPRPRSMHAAWPDHTNVPSLYDEPVPNPSASPPPAQTLTQAQTRVLNSIPTPVLRTLLKEMQHHEKRNTPQECRFCKNNGEREAYYRSHVLKDAWGRVACPVLRALVCRRCGARGDLAHTIKYCPLSTNEERIKSAAMMRSVRMASGKRRHSYAPSANDTPDYIMFGEPTPSVAEGTHDYVNYAQTPLDPLWAALEQKLML